MTIRNMRINASTKVVPEGVTDLGGLESMIKDHLDDLSSDKLGAITDIKAAKRALTSGIDQSTDLIEAIANIPSLDIGSIETALTSVLGPEAGAQAAKALDAVKKFPKGVIDALKEIVEKLSCVLSGVDTTALIYGLAGLFALGNVNLCNPLDTLAKVLQTTSGLLDKNPSQTTRNKITTLTADAATVPPILSTPKPALPVPVGGIVPEDVAPFVNDAGLSISMEVKPIVEEEVNVYDTLDVNPDDYTEDELRVIYDQQEFLDTTTPAIVGGYTSLITKDGNINSEAIEDEAGKLRGFKPDEPVYMEDILSIKPVIPPSIAQACNKAVGIGITQNFRQGASVPMMIVCYLANPAWVVANMPALPEAIVSSIEPNKPSPLDADFIEHLDTIYEGWHRRATKNANDKYTGLNKYAQASDRLKPDIKICRRQELTLSGGQILMLLAKEKSTLPPTSTYKQIPFVNT